MLRFVQRADFTGKEQSFWRRKSAAMVLPISGGFLFIAFYFAEGFFFLLKMVVPNTPAQETHISANQSAGLLPSPVPGLLFAGLSDSAGSFVSSGSLGSANSVCPEVPF